jgi:hypothetical protein
MPLLCRPGWGPAIGHAADIGARPWCRRVGVGDQPQVGDDPPQPGWVQVVGGGEQDRFGLGGGVGWGRSWVPWASTAAWAADSWPSVRALAVPVRGPRNRAWAVRTQPLAVLVPMWRRARSQLVVEGAGWPWSAQAAPQASTAASSSSQWPSRRSSSRRSTRIRSARTASASPFRSWWPGCQRPRPGPLVHRASWPNVCSSPWRQPINPPPEHKHPCRHLGTTVVAALPARICPVIHHPARQRS